MSDCFVLYLLLTCMKKKTSGADKFTNNNPCNYNHRFITYVYTATSIHHCVNKSRSGATNTQASTLTI